MKTNGVCALQVVGGWLEAEILQEQVWCGCDRQWLQEEGGSVVCGGPLLGAAILLSGEWISF